MQSKKGKLSICPTPIGNLEDITIRVLRTLRKADLIAAEDTRRTGNLLKKFKIKTPLISYHQHNEAKRSKELINKLKDGQWAALVSDAGTPGLSDPGLRLIKQCLKESIIVEVLPGPSAILTAIVSSGIVEGPFAFLGFPPRRLGKRNEFLKNASDLDMSLVIYEAPHRLLKFLKEMEEYFYDRNVALARELTKMHEEIIRGPLPEVVKEIEKKPRKGEIVIVVEAPKIDRQIEIKEEEVIGNIKNYLNMGMSQKDAIIAVAKKKKLPKNRVYEIAIKKKDLF